MPKFGKWNPRRPAGREDTKRKIQETFRQLDLMWDKRPGAAALNIDMGPDLGVARAAKRQAPGRSNGATESDVKKSVLAYLKTRRDLAWFAIVNGGLFFEGNRPVHSYRLYLGRTFRPEKHSGISDIIGQRVSGRFFAMELKRERGGRLTEDQIEFGQAVLDNGGEWWCIRSVEEAQAALDGRLAKMSDDSDE